MTTIADEGALPPGSYLGTSVNSLVVNRFILTESTYKANQFIPAHQHENAFFYLVLNGVSLDACGGRMLTCQPGTLVYHPRGDEHSNAWLDSGGRCFHFELALDPCSLLDGSAPSLDRLGHYTGGLPVWIATRLHSEFRSPDSVSRLVIEGLLLELLASVCREQEPGAERRPKWLVAARETILARCTEELSLAGLAAESAVHPTHFARAFRRAYGCSVGEFVRKARIERACHLLVQGRVPLSRLGLDLGFFDQSHFCRVFKRLAGMTPSQFAKRFGPR